MCQDYFCILGVSDMFIYIACEQALQETLATEQEKEGELATMSLEFEYRIYSINRPGRLLNFWTLRVGAYSRWAFIRGWALIKFSPFSGSEVCLHCNKTIHSNNKTRRSNKARFL